MSSFFVFGVDVFVMFLVVKCLMGDFVCVVVLGWFGIVLEFMDFQLYLFVVVLVFSQLFFVDEGFGMVVVFVMVIYGVGYVVCLIGVFVFVCIGDKIGWCKVFFYMIFLMGVVIMFIGFLLIYQQVGILVLIFFVIFCFVQGFGVGVEIFGVGVMLLEYVLDNCCGIIVLLVVFGINCGMLFVLVIWVILFVVMFESDVIEWGWCIFFIGSVVIMLFVLWVWFSLKESLVFEECFDVVDGKVFLCDEVVKFVIEINDICMFELLYCKLIKVIIVFFFLCFGQVGNFGFVQMYFILFIMIIFVMLKEVGFEVVIVFLLIGFLMIFFVGFLGDCFGCCWMYIIMILLLFVLIVLMLLMINIVEFGWVFVGYVIIYNVLVFGFVLMENILILEIFGVCNCYMFIVMVCEIVVIIVIGIGLIIVVVWVLVIIGSIILVMVLMGVFIVFVLVVVIWVFEWMGCDFIDLCFVM